MTSAEDWIEDGPQGAATTLVLAHGAGAAMDTGFMSTIARELGAAGFHVVRFEFPYMAARRRDGRKRAPDRQPVLLDCWREAVARIRDRGHTGRLVIGGKSLGGRMASLVADELGVDGLLVLGYPFHPPGRPDRPRIEHLATLATPALILQGERDPFGRPDEVAGYRLTDDIRVEWVPDGDHSFRPRKRSGRTEEENLTFAAEAARAFLGSGH